MDKTIARTVTPAPLPPALTSWLAKLTLLHGVPFNYLVADARLLAPESIKFFEIDPTWSEAMLDGALSIGRHYTAAGVASPSQVAELTGRAAARAAVRAAVPGVRRQQLKQSGGDADPGPDVMTGFLLRSTAVSGWKSLDVLAYAQGHSPYEYEQGTIGAEQVQALDILRLERLSPTVLFGLFRGQLCQLVLHQPPEAVHFGVDTQDPQGNQITKTLRVPSTGWDDPQARYTTQTEQHLPFDQVFADAARRVVDLHQLSRAMGAALAAIGKDPGYYAQEDRLLSSDFALEMVKGVGLVSFVNRPLPEASR